MLGIAEMIRCGTTSFADMYFFMDDTARAVAESGIRACLSRGMTGITPSAETALKENRQLFLDWHKKGDGRTRWEVTPREVFHLRPDVQCQAVYGIVQTLKAGPQFTHKSAGFIQRVRHQKLFQIGKIVVHGGASHAGGSGNICHGQAR